MAPASRHHRPFLATLALAGIALILSGHGQTRTTPVGPDGKPAPFRQDPAVRSIQKQKERTRTTTPVDTRQAKPLIPRQVKASPDTYLGREIRVAGQPTLKLDPATGKWTGTSDGMAVEATAEARAYYERMKPLGKRPVFRAELVRRGGEYVLLYKAGIEPDK